MVYCELPQTIQRNQWWASCDSKTLSDDSWLAIDLGSQYIIQRNQGRNNHKLQISSYDEKHVDYNLTFVNVKDCGWGKDKGRGRGGPGQSTNLSFQGRGFIPSGQWQRNNNNNDFTFAPSSFLSPSCSISRIIHQKVTCNSIC